MYPGMDSEMSVPARRRLSNLLALALMMFLAAVNLFRAATQSITADEAFTYNHFAGGDEPLRVYDANNHVLFTWLARLSVGIFGPSELSLRLPSVLGGWLYFAGVYRLASLLFAEGWLFLLAAASLTLNPFVLDFLSAARGYGLAMAFFIWAIYELARGMQEEDLPAARVHRAAIWLALAAASNLTLGPPAAALGATFSLLAVWRWPPLACRLSWLARHLVLPCALLAIAILALPLRTATRANFYAGVDSLRQTLQGLVFYSFCHARPEAPSYLATLLWDWSHWFVPGVFGLVALACVVLMTRAAQRGLIGLRPAERVLLLAGGTAWLTLGLLAAAYRGFGLKYPVDRTAVYWIPLFTLLCVVGLQAIRPTLVFWLAGPPTCLFLSLAVVQYGLQFNTRFYAQWRWDASTKHIVNLIRAREASAPRQGVRVGATWLFEPSLNFYRQRYGLRWLERVTRDGPRGQFDYYVLHGEDRSLLGELQLVVLHDDAFSGTVLAAPPVMIESRP